MRNLLLMLPLVYQQKVQMYLLQILLLLPLLKKKVQGMVKMIRDLQNNLMTKRTFSMIRRIKKVEKEKIKKNNTFQIKIPQRTDQAIDQEPKQENLIQVQYLNQPAKRLKKYKTITILLQKNHYLDLNIVILAIRVIAKMMKSMRQTKKLNVLLVPRKNVKSYTNADLIN